MLSPAIYEEIVLPFHQELFRFLEERGVAHRPLVAGGNLLPLLPELVKCGANQFLLDYQLPLEKVKTVLQEYPRCCSE